MSNDLLKLETRITDILQDRTSSNGTPYTALVLPDGEWVFVWEGDWKEEIEKNAEIYQDLEVELFVVDKEEDPDDHFYNLKAVLPTDLEVAKKLFEKKIENNQPELKQKEKQRLMREVEEMYDGNR